MLNPEAETEKVRKARSQLVFISNVSFAVLQSTRCPMAKYTAQDINSSMLMIAFILNNFVTLTK